jgi:glyceraldehyde 3-phosphate dehydrogenase
VGGHELQALSIAEPKALPWRKLGDDIVVESTGRFTKRKQAQAHLDAGAGSVVISAVANDADVMVVLGVNDDAYNPAWHRISRTPPAQPTACRCSPRCYTTRWGSSGAS